MRFVIDMNLSPLWVDVLIRVGHEAEHWSNLGPATAEDSAIVEYARSNDSVILTNDLDFGILLALGGLNTPSVIQLRAQAVLPADLSEQLLATITATEPHLVAGALVTVTSDRHRVTVLPIDKG